MQTPYEGQSYQTPTSSNCKPFRTQLCKLLLSAHETKVPTMDTHLKLNATQLKQLTQTQTYPLLDQNVYSDPPRNMKATISYNNEDTNMIISKLDITSEKCTENLKHIHTTITSQYLSSKNNKKVTNQHLIITFIQQNKNYHVTCVQNWHSSEQTNHHSCKVTYIQ